MGPHVRRLFDYRAYWTIYVILIKKYKIQSRNRLFPGEEKRNLLSKIQTVGAHESERVSCPSQLSLQTLLSLRGI